MVNVSLHWCCAARIDSSCRIWFLWLFKVVYLLITKSPPPKWPEVDEKCLKSHILFTFCSGRRPNSCYVGSQPLYFHNWFYISKVSITQEGISRSQSGSLTTNAAWIGQTTYKNIQNKSPVCPRRGPGSCNIGNQPLYVHYMTISMIVRAQEGICRSQNGSLTTKLAWIGQKTPKLTQNNSLSALAGDPTAVTSVLTYSTTLYLFLLMIVRL